MINEARNSRKVLVVIIHFSTPTGALGSCTFVLAVAFFRVRSQTIVELDATCMVLSSIPPVLTQLGPTTSNYNHDFPSLPTHPSLPALYIIPFLFFSDFFSNSAPSLLCRTYSARWSSSKSTHTKHSPARQSTTSLFSSGCTRRSRNV